MKLKPLLLISLLAVGFSTTAYAKESTQQQEIAVEVAPIQLTKEQMLEDYHYMWGVIEDSYPFLGVVERQGIDYKVLKAQGVQTIMEQDLTPEAFYMLMGKTLGSLQYTGHISVIPYYQYDYMKAVYTQMGELRAWHSEALSQEHVSKFYGYLSEKYPMETGVGENQELIANTENLTTKILDDDQIAYMKINNFGTENIQPDAVKLEKFYQEISDYPYLIIDLTENGGGNDLYWMNNIVGAALREPISYTTEVFLNDGYFTNAYMMNIYTKEYFNERQDTKELEMIETFVANNSDLEDLPYYIAQETQLNPLPTGPLFNGEIYILMDESVYSSSESFVKFCKDTGFATLVGTPSGGDGGGIDPMIVATPNSGVAFKFSVLYTINSDGKNNEEFGTTPDYTVEDGQEPLEACLEIIKANQ